VRDANDRKLVLITGVGPVPVGADAMSAHIRALDEAVADRFDGYRAHLAAAPLAAHTRRTYAGRVAGYLAWLAELDPLTRRRQGDPFTDGYARDYTVRDYRTHLLTVRRAKPASVNLALAAVDHFYRFVGLGPANTRREQLPQAAPRALDTDQTRRLLYRRCDQSAARLRGPRRLPAPAAPGPCLTAPRGGSLSARGRVSGWRRSATSPPSSWSTMVG